MTGKQRSSGNAEDAARKAVLELARLLARLAAQEDDAAERKSRQGTDAAGTHKAAPAAQGQPHSTE